MPYISKERRNAIDMFVVGEPSTSGEINYLISMVIKGYLGPNPNYERFNSAIGVLEAAKLELYRRMVAPYEDTKIAENGDVY